MWELDYKVEYRRIDAFKLWCWRTSWEFLELQGAPTSQSWRKSVLNIHWKDCCWSCNSNTLTIWCEEITHLKRPWCWERLKAGGEGDNREWDDWMASPHQWTWVWASSGSWWRTGKPGGLQGVTKIWTQLSGWTGVNVTLHYISYYIISYVQGTKCCGGNKPGWGTGDAKKI